MKAKKKVTASAKKHKRSSTDTVIICTKTNVTTKERTHATIEEQIAEGKPSIRSSKISTPRTRPPTLDCLELSPFSSQEGNSFSPRFRNSLSPQEKKKKVKPKWLNPKKKSEGKPKAKLTKEETSQVAYQNLLVRRMNEKKITQRSQESDHSPSRLRRNCLKKTKYDFVRDMRMKIVEKYKRVYPNLQPHQLRLYASIVVIQRLWRQRKVKEFINQFMSPRQINPSVSMWIPRQQNLSKLDITNATQQLRKLTSSPNQKPFVKELQSTQLNPDSGKKENHELPLELQISEQLAPNKERHEKIVRFVTSYRDLAFSQTKSKEKKIKNVFNLTESFSQSCLMQNLYSRIFKSSPQKIENFELFSLKCKDKSLQKSREMMANLKSPQKHQIIQLQERFYTEVEDELQGNVMISPNLLNQKFHNSPAFDQLEQFSQQVISHSKLTQSQGVQWCVPQIKTIQNLQDLSDQLIIQLCDQFSREYTSFTSKSTIKKEKQKKQLPGLNISPSTVTQYLTGMSEYLFSKYEATVMKRFQVIDPRYLLRFYHAEEEEEEEESEFSLPIIPNTVFYEYQCQYQANLFRISKEDAKYTNFLQGLIKIHNLSLINCLSEELERKRVERIWQPWDHDCRIVVEMTPKRVREEFNQIIKKVSKNCFKGIGQLHHRSEGTEQKKVLSMIHDEYASEDREWQAQDQRLQIRIEVAQWIYCQLLSQLSQIM